MTVHPMMPGSWRSTPGGVRWIVRGIVQAITAKYCDRDLHNHPAVAAARPERPDVRAE